MPPPESSAKVVSRYDAEQAIAVGQPGHGVPVNSLSDVEGVLTGGCPEPHAAATTLTAISSVREATFGVADNRHAGTTIEIRTNDCIAGPESCRGRLRNS